MLNKKVLITAIVGVLFAGSAAATNFTTGTAVPGAPYGTEIPLSVSGTATSFTGAAAEVDWLSGYAYSEGEVRYVRIQAGPNVVFAAGAGATATAVTTAGNALIGAVNGIGTNVITFSVTGGTGGSPATTPFKLTATLNFTSTADSAVSVSLYDQPSEAQAGGTTGLISGGSVSGPYISFANSLAWSSAPTTATADVEANPSFTLFTTGLGTAQLNTLGIVASTAGTVEADGATPLTPALLLDPTSSVVVTGDFAFTANTDGTFPVAGATAFGAAATKLTATSATFSPVASGVASPFNVAQGTAKSVIGAGSFSAHLNAVKLSPYNAPVLADAVVGTIDHNGTELQAPLAQIPAGYISRLVLTNTGSTARAYTIGVMGEAGSTVTGTTANLTGTIPANGTKVIDDLSTVFSGGSRATLNVNVAGPTTQIQGMYQIVNPASGSVSNTVLVRPGTN